MPRHHLDRLLDYNVQTWRFGRLLRPGGKIGHQLRQLRLEPDDHRRDIVERGLIRGDGIDTARPRIPPITQAQRRSDWG